MKEICGFLDTNGKFHKSEKLTKIANNKIALAEIEKKLDNFHEEVSWIFYRSGSDLRTFEGIQYINNDDIKENHYNPIEAIKERVYKQVSLVILRDTEEWQNIINKRKSLEKELDYLKSVTKRDKWWLKFNWWKS